MKYLFLTSLKTKFQLNKHLKYYHTQWKYPPVMHSLNWNVIWRLSVLSVVKKKICQIDCHFCQYVFESEFGLVVFPCGKKSTVIRKFSVIAVSTTGQQCCTTSTCYAASFVGCEKAFKDASCWGRGAVLYMGEFTLNFNFIYHVNIRALHITYVRQMVLFKHDYFVNWPRLNETLNYIYVLLMFL